VSRYYYLIILIALFNFGCSSKLTKLVPNSYKVLGDDLTSNFSQEDTYVMYALDAQNRGDFKNAAKYYKELYSETKNEIYVNEAIKYTVISKDYDSIKGILEEVKQNKHHNPTLDKYLVAYYIDNKQFKKAKELTDKIIKEERSVKNLELSALTYEGIGDIDKAYSFFQEAYQKGKSKYSLLKMSDILFINKKQKQKAVRLLESDATINGCSLEICGRLIQLYQNLKDINGIESTLLKLYKSTKNPIYATKLIQLYGSTKSNEKALKFLKESGFDDLLLLDIYTSKKDYKNAQKLAEKLYKESGELTLLARSAILEYENSTNKKSKKLLKSISEKFDKVIDKLDDPLYYNYYGYILIDNSIDIDRGISLVKKALKVEPKSLFYIDSLAWGMYKKNECEQAYNLLKPYEDTSKEKEIKEHIMLIKNCIKANEI